MFLNGFQVFNCSVSVHFCFVEASGGAAAPGERVVRGSRVEGRVARKDHGATVKSLHCACAAASLPGHHGTVG